MDAFGAPAKQPPAGIIAPSTSGTHDTNSGAKTPRKVQWVDAQETIPNPQDSSHALDEHGNDPNAFQTLTTALERHQSGESGERKSEPRIHYFPPRPANLPPLNTQPIVLSSGQSTVTTLSEGELSLPPSPIHAVPGNFIDLDENAGLPGTEDLEDYSHRAARKVVRAHTRKGLFGRFGRRRAKQKAEDSEPRADVEQNLHSAEAMNPPVGGGVLSALLTLYNDPSANGSTPSTPGIEEPWHTPPKKHGEEIPLISKGGTTTSPKDSIGRTHVRSGSQASLAAKLRIGPQTPRNSAGVLGALIASTGNISGAAAPVSSQLVPNLKRPGYHLSRYSLDDGKLPRAAPKTPERPRSMNELQLMSSASVPSLRETLSSKLGWSEKLKDLEHMAFGGGVRSGRSTPAGTPSTDTENEEWPDERWREQETHREKRKKRKKAEVYITRHVAQIIQRQEFILKLTRAFMMFGGPSHRLQAQIQATGRVLDIQVNCMYLPDVVLISFDDNSTGTSNLKFIRQGSSLNLGKLIEAYELYWSVIHDEQSVSEASGALDALMRKKQEYSWWQLILTGGFCSSSICSVSFNGSFIDSLVVFPLGCLLVAIQLLSVRNELYSNIFEITVATLFSFISAGLASTHKFCYSAVASSSVVLILPGFIVLCGSLEIMSRNIVSGSVRMCYAVVYSLFLGFGLAIGAEAYQKITGHEIVGSTDYTCSASHQAHGPWYQRTPAIQWAFLTVPMYSLFLSMRNHAPWRKKEIVLLVGIACIGWVTNHFSSLKFKNQNDITAAVGAFTVGIIANVYARFFSGNAFVIMITGIFFQLPSGLGNGGLLTFASETVSGSSSSYLSGFQTALQLISVAIGLTVGLGLSLALVHPIQSRRRAGGVFSL